MQNIAAKILFVAITLNTPVFGQDNPETVPNEVVGTPQVTEVGVMSSFEFWMSIVVVVFAVFVISSQTYLMSKLATRIDPNDILRNSAVTFVVAGTLLAVTAGFDSEHIAPAMGLFGTIVGYLLGRAQGTQSENEIPRSEDKTGVSK